jgi:hypothetical protein
VTVTDSCGIAATITIIQEGLIIKSGELKASVEVDNKESLTEIVAYPNPFYEDINIEFYLLESEKLKIDIYDIQGNRITEIEENFHAGFNKFQWDGTNYESKKVISGLYFININGRKFKRTIKASFFAR